MVLNTLTKSYLNDTITGVTGGEGNQRATAAYNVNKIVDPSSVIITADASSGLVTIKTTDKNPKQVTATIDAKGGLGAWSAIGDAT